MGWKDAQLGYIGIMEKKMEVTMVYWGYSGKKMETTLVRWGYVVVYIFKVTCFEMSTWACGKVCCPALRIS